MAYRKLCKFCQGNVVGRSDKIFCTIKCKNDYHADIKRKIRPHLKKVMRFLERNYIIIFELLGNSGKRKIFIPRLELNKKGFKFNYYTSSYLNSEGKTYYRIGGFSWMEFTSDDIMIVSNKKVVS